MRLCKIEVKLMKPDNKKTEILMEDIPTITPEMMEKTAIEIAKRRAGKTESPVKNVKNIVCPSCENAAMDYADDLVFDITLAGERIVIPNLSGIRCGKCADVSFDAKSTKIIEKYVAGKSTGGYEASISNVGGGKTGMYFPKDIVRIMDIKKSDKVIMTPLSNHKMIVELLESNT